MPTEATTPHVGINVPDSYFSLAGFQVTLIGRFWVTPEAHIRRVLIAQVTVFVQSAIDDSLQFQWKVGVQPHG
jgi:hypothetical protein